MKRLALSVLLLMPACGQNPLLKMTASDYQPIRLGSQWDYITPSGATFSRKAVASLNYAGKDAFQIDTYFLGITSTSYVAYDGASVQVYNASTGWTISRKLPYVTGNRWDLPTTVPNQALKLYVDGNEDVVTPAGTYRRCFRLRQETSTYSPGSGLTSTSTSAYFWSAPDVGDVQPASVGGSG